MKTIHNSEDFEGMRKAGNLAAKTLDLLTNHVKPGTSTAELDRIAFDFIDANNGFIAPLFYKGFPKSICTSLNHVICCLLYTSPSPRDPIGSRMPSSA